MANGGVDCMHPGCLRPAVKVVANQDRPNTLGQTHDCCNRHCSPRKGGTDD